MMKTFSVLTGLESLSLQVMLSGIKSHWWPWYDCREARHWLLQPVNAIGLYDVTQSSTLAKCHVLQSQFVGLGGFLNHLKTSFHSTLGSPVSAASNPRRINFRECRDPSQGRRGRCCAMLSPSVQCQSNCSLKLDHCRFYRKSFYLIRWPDSSILQFFKTFSLFQFSQLLKLIRTPSALIKCLVAISTLTD